MTYTIYLIIYIQINNINRQDLNLQMSDIHQEQIKDEDDNTHQTNHQTTNNQQPEPQQENFNYKQHDQIARHTNQHQNQNQHEKQHKHQHKQQKQQQKQERLEIRQENQQGESQHRHQRKQSSQQQRQEKIKSLSSPVEKQKHHQIDHATISKYASFSLDIEHDQKNQVYLRIVGVQSKGSAFSKYTTYNIKGHDKNGEISIQRRYSEFYALRNAMVQRWPGCFIPSIPTKNFMHKNDKDETIKRQRYLNDFVIKMTRLPYLYNSEQFQTFLRSKQIDISGIYSSWAAPTYDAIINKYKDCFSDLAGKQIDSGTISNIGQFYARIKKNASLLEKYRAFAKNLALSRDRFNHAYPLLFSKIIPNYQKIILAQLTNGKQDQMIYQNGEQAKLNQHPVIITQSSSKNPYWALYDMIKHEQRDGRAFLQAIQARQSLENKRTGVQNKIKDNQLAIIQLMQGKSNLKSFTSKGTKQQVKYKLQVENQQLKKQKNLLLVLSDIISALIVYIQIPAYQYAKINFYNKTLKKIGGYELNAVQIQGDIWKDINKASERLYKNSGGKDL